MRKILEKIEADNVLERLKNLSEASQDYELNQSLVKHLEHDLRINFPERCIDGDKK